jgi:succinate dehydrogenase/fumarate reductase flavoprotein subunit
MKRKKEHGSRFTRRAFLRTAAAAGAAGFAGTNPAQAQTPPPPARWTREADVVVIGSGAAGLPAAIAARQRGASVFVVEANFDVGGHAILSSGNVALGGGTSRQKTYGVADSPDLVFSDLTDWSVVEPNGFPDYRYNDREIIRAFADNSAPTYEFLVAHGVTFVEKAPDNVGAGATGNSVPRENHAAPLEWPLVQTGQPVAASAARTGSSGVGVIRPLEASARKIGVDILLQHRMTAIIREHQNSGRVIGITVVNGGRTLTIRAKKGVVIATGGSSSNVNFRRMFDPRLTEEYCGVAGEPYTPQDASGELAAMAVGASLWGGFNQTAEFGQHITKPGRIGCQYGYVSLTWEPTSPLFPRVRAVGLRVADYHDLILVNKTGRRFYDETVGQYTQNNYDAVKDYVPHSWRNAANLNYNPRNFLNAALAGTPGEAVNGGGPIWAIFDAEAVKREKWTVAPPFVDAAEGFFFSAESIGELAGRIVNRYQTTPMKAHALQGTVARYNGFVDSGTDEDFGKQGPKYKIQTPPFYAAWATPVIHDTRVGLRIDGQCRVIDMLGQVIPGLYCGGESAGGFSLHGLARCTVQGRLAGLHAAAEP